MTNNFKTKWVAGMIMLAAMKAILLADAGSTNLLANGDFQGGQEHWTLFTNGPTIATLTFNDDASIGKRAASIAVSPQNGPGELWFVTLRQAGIAIVQGKTYLLSFQMKASQGTGTFVTFTQNTSPWGKIPGIEGKQLGLTEDWQPFSYQFTAQSSEPDARFSLTNLYKPGFTFYLSSMSLTEVPAK
jgi:hypothetical protein